MRYGCQSQFRWKTDSLKVMTPPVLVYRLDAVIDSAHAFTGGVQRHARRGFRVAPSRLRQLGSDFE